MASGKNPYLQEPLYSCEAQKTAPYMWRASGNVSNPAPLPPYALALFIPLTKIPFLVASAIWTLGLCAAYAITLLSLRSLTTLSWPLLSAAILPGALMSVSLGQIAPIAIGSLCFAAALARIKPQFAGAIAAFSLIEPHIALPSCIALFAVNKRCRLGMCLWLLVLAGLSLLAGAALTGQYLREVLPAHALSDVSDVGQFSTTLIAHMAGAADGIALLTGSLSYTWCTAVGIAMAIMLARRKRDQALVVLIPPAFAVLGGAYLHWQQIVAAVPAALLLSRYQRHRSFALAAAMVVLPVPWLYVTAWGFLIPLAVVVVAILAFHCWNRNLAVALAASVCTFCALWFANHALPPDHVAAAFTPLVRSDHFADLSWGQYVRARIAARNGIFWWAHFPTWTGLATVVCCAIRQSTFSRSAKGATRGSRAPEDVNANAVGTLSYRTSASMGGQG